MKNNNKGFTLIELLAVIVVLAIVMAIAVTSILPSMTSAREEAFRVESTRIIKRAQEAYRMYQLGELDVKGDTKSCVTASKACFTVAELIDKNISNFLKESKGSFMDSSKRKKYDVFISHASKDRKDRNYIR